MPPSPTEDIQRWVERVVVGLDLCPFARAPLEADRVRIVESRAGDTAELLAELLDEISLLDEDDTPADTSLLVFPSLTPGFDEFLDLVDAANALLEETGDDARWQIAHFHPDYCFEGVPSDDPANHTNRAPHPVLHLLRWSDVRHAMETHPDVGHIPRRNQALLRGLGVDALPNLNTPARRDFRHALSGFKFWDLQTQAIFEERQGALEDCILQNREEVIGLAEFIEEKGIRSTLEIGVWTGRLVTALHHVFDFDRVAAVDRGRAEHCGFELRLPEATEVFRGDSVSEDFHAWREALGAIDLVLIDAHHTHDAFLRDFEINRRYPHRFLAFLDITGANRKTTGVRRFWDDLEEGHKRTIFRPHAELGLDHSTMGIGIWSENEVP